MKPGDTIGPWTLGARLGRGGNGEVWTAVKHGDDEFAALKAPFRFSGEPYARFVREVRTQLGCAEVPGVLPILDSYLPESPSKADRPWYAMPVCETADVALAGAGLRDVVAAISSFAETLAQLHARDIAHRDIKPQNLYRYCESWRIGDFGLIDVPDLESLTVTGKPLGPRFYLPPELLDPTNVSDFRPADVFMLAKTLWTLTTGQSFPMPGEQRADVVPYRLETWVTFARTRDLDQLIERCTRAVADDRPSMPQVASDLHAWLALIDEPSRSAVDRSHTMERLQRAVSPRVARDERVALLRARYDELLGLSNELLSPLERELTAYGQPERGAYDTTTEQELQVPKFSFNRSMIERRSPFLRLTGPPGAKTLVLGVGRFLALTDDDDFLVGGALYIAVEVGSSMVRPESHTVGLFVAPGDSVEAEANVRRVGLDIDEHAAEWIDRFASHIGALRRS